MEGIDIVFIDYQLFPDEMMSMDRFVGWFANLRYVVSVVCKLTKCRLRLWFNLLDGSIHSDTQTLIVIGGVEKHPFCWFCIGFRINSK